MSRDKLLADYSDVCQRIANLGRQIEALEDERDAARRECDRIEKELRI